MKKAYQQNGYYRLANAVTPAEIGILLQELAVLDKQMNRYGVRNLMHKVPYIRQFANSPAMLAIAEEILGTGARPVRAVYFDKIPEANWSVAWHQDTSIAVQASVEVIGFGPWSVKDGVAHAEPPEEYLQNMLTLRVHLDAADQRNGVLKVIPGSHRNGRIKSREILALLETTQAIDCVADAGDILLMAPLLLHASHKAKNPTHRRILHLEYSAMDLPAPLQWHDGA